MRATSDEKSVVSAALTDSRRTFRFAALRILSTVSERPMLYESWPSTITILVARS
jgi:hypothetical protein